MLVHLASLLLLYLSPSETYVVCSALIGSTRTQLQRGREAKLKWHVPMNQAVYCQTLSAFVGGLMLQLPLCAYCHSQRQDFTKLVDSGLRTLLTSYLQLHNLTDFILVFVHEGQKALFGFLASVFLSAEPQLRETYSKKLKILQALPVITADMETGELHRVAFQFKIKKQPVPSVSARVVQHLQERHNSEMLVSYMPAQTVGSSIVSFEMLAQLWTLLP